MKCQLFETKEISYEVTLESNRPKEIKSENLDSKDEKFKDVIVCWLCIEAEDSIEDAEIILNEIQKYSKMISKKVVLTPFIHLSKNASTNSSLNKKLLNYICKNLEGESILKSKIPYGYHRILYTNWLTFGHPVSFAFRDSKY